MPSRFEFEAIGTRWQIDVFDELDRAREEIVLARVRKRIADFDAVYSRFRPDSLVMQMAQSAGDYAFPHDAGPMIALYKRAYDATGGAVTPLIGQVLVDAGYDAEYSLQPRSLTRPPAWEEVIDFATPILHMKRPALLDFGAAGKGYLIDLVAEVLRSEGIGRYCVDAGGDMVHRDSMGAGLRVGLEHPDRLNEVIGVVSLANASLCGSAGNRRAWGEYHHVIDPHSLQSPRRVRAVWVVAESTLVADMLTTCLFFVSPEQLAGEFTFEYCMVYADYSARVSAGFPGELFS